MKKEEIITQLVAAVIAATTSLETSLSEEQLRDRVIPLSAKLADAILTEARKPKKGKGKK
jgi:hypothetical protein